MYEKGLGINPSAAEKIQIHLQGKMTVEISNLLNNLTDSNLVPKNELSVRPSRYAFSVLVSLKINITLMFYYFHS